MSKAITLLHLSDIHFGAEPDARTSETALAQRTNALNSLIDTLSGFKGIWRPNILVVSGDLAWKARRNDYSHAREWLGNGLLPALRLCAAQVVICPGNHDINRLATTGMLPPPDAEVADDWLKYEHLDNFARPFVEFSQFCEDLGCPPLQIGGHETHLVGCRDIAGLRFVVLNSAWFCRGDTDRHNLWIGLPQLELMNSHNQLLAPSAYNSGPVCISILHHPTSWLNEAEVETSSAAKRPSAYGYLAERTHIILSGHVHSGPERPHRFHGYAHMFTGGATYAGPNYGNHFSLLHVDVKKREVTQLPYEYDPRYAKWVPHEKSSHSLRSDSHVRATDLQRGRASGKSPRPPQARHNLEQRLYSHFIGRKKDLDLLITLTLPTSRHFLVTVDGVGGVGKSALVQELAYYYVENFGTLPREQRFEAVVWLSAKETYLTADGIRGRKNNFRNLSDLYRVLANVLEAPHLLKANPGDQPLVAEKLLTSRRVLLIVDNLETVDEEPLVSFLRELPPPTKCLVTTRHRIDVAYPLRLEPLPLEEGLAMVNAAALDKAVALSPEVAASLCRDAGGVPLAIVWSIALISIGYSQEGVLARLKSGRSDLAHFCFDGSVDHIRNSPSYDLLCAMSIFDSSVSREMLSDTAGLPADVLLRDRAFAVLLQLSLFDREGGRFTALPLTRSFAFAALQADTPRAIEVQKRWAAVLLAFAQPFAEIGWIWHNLSELSIEGGHLVTLSAWALQMDRADVFVGVAPALEFYYDITGQWNERLSTNETGVRFARLLGDALHLFIFLRNLCGLLGQRGRYPEALDAATEALKVARQNQQPSWEIKALLSLSGLMRRQQEFERSVQYCNAALNRAESVGTGDRNAAVASVRYELGKVARDRGEWSVAEDHFRASRDVFGYLDESGHFDIARAWGVLTNLGYVTFKLGALDEAAKIHEQCLEYCLSAGSRGSVATLLTRLAEIELARGDRSAAGRHASEALVWTARLGMVHEHSEAQKLLALIEHPVEPVETLQLDQIRNQQKGSRDNN